MTKAQHRSPWSHLNGVKSVKVLPVNRDIDDRVTVPGSKSYTNRALIIAAAAKGTTSMSGLLRSDDTWWCIDALQRLGAKFSWRNGMLCVTGTGGHWSASEVYIGSAGTIARFLPGLLAASRDPRSYTLTASAQLSLRPIGGLKTALVDLGAELKSARKHLSFPLKILGNSLKSGSVKMSGAESSQFISGVLIAAAMVENGPVHIEITDHIVQKDYVQITTEIMEQFGAKVQTSDDFMRFEVQPSPYTSTVCHLEADASTATYFMAIAAGTGGQIDITNLNPDTTQPDIGFLGVLERLGAHVERREKGVMVRGPSNGALRGGQEFDMLEMSDATLTLAALAPFCSGPIIIKNVAHIRKHESDRIAVMCQSLTQLGIEVEELADGMVIKPGKPHGRHVSGPLETHDDHRVAMSLSVIGALGNGVELLDPGCVSKTCPDFFKRIAKIGVTIINRSGRVDASSSNEALPKLKTNPF